MWCNGVLSIKSMNGFLSIKSRVLIWWNGFFHNAWTYALTLTYHLLLNRVCRFNLRVGDWLAIVIIYHNWHPVGYFVILR